jgi:hypothetical protein
VDCEASATATPAMNSFFFIPILPQFRSENLRKKRVNGQVPVRSFGSKNLPANRLRTTTPPPRQPTIEIVRFGETGGREAPDHAIRHTDLRTFGRHILHCKL